MILVAGEEDFDLYHKHISTNDANETLFGKINLQVLNLKFYVLKTN